MINKKSLIKIVVFMLVTKIFAEESLKKTMLTTNVVALASGMISAKYERMISKKNSWGIGGVLWNYNTEGWKWNAYGGEFIYKNYLNLEKSPAGLWWGVGVGFTNINVERTTSYGTSTGNVNFFAPGAFLGYSWLLGNNKNFIISFFGSVSYSVGNAEIDGEKLPYGGSSAGIGAEVGLVF